MAGEHKKNDIYLSLNKLFDDVNATFICGATIYAGCSY